MGKASRTKRERRASMHGSRPSLIVLDEVAHLDDEKWRRALAVSDGPMQMVRHDHAALRTPAEFVYDDDPDVRLLVTRMHRTNAVKRGKALAACQVGLPFSIVVVDDGSTWFNVTVEDRFGGTETAIEGCLSLPGRWFAVERALRARIVARPLGRQEATVRQVVNYEARLWQHEADHLAGRLISDRWPYLRSPTSSDVPPPLGSPARELWDLDRRLAARAEELVES